MAKMKIVFSTKNVNRASFLDTCRYAYDYGFSGFEIYDAIKERSQHHDSILRQERTPDAKRKLIKIKMKGSVEPGGKAEILPNKGSRSTPRSNPIKVTPSIIKGLNMLR